jgi:hypothetical protein
MRHNQHTDFWKAHPGLVWSNPRADDAIFIRAALLRPQFERLLDIAVEFGLERVEAEWKILVEEDTREARRAAGIVARILKHLKEGYDRAHAGA